MKKMFLGALILVVFTTISLLGGKIGALKYVATSEQEASSQSASDLPNGAVREYKIEPGDTFAEVIGKTGIPYEEITSILNSSKEVFDFTKITAGKVLKLVFVQEAFAAMEYPVTNDTVVHVKKENNAFKVTEEEIQYVVETKTAEGVIADSLFIAAKQAGLEDKATLELANIFSSSVDFATEVQKGDSFSLVYEKRFLDGKEMGAGKILAAKFTNDGETYTAFLYEDKYYDAEGRSVARQFLKSPLNFARISSGFSYQRTNPVTKQVTPHRAIDYAADTGTPVIATANGKVSVAGSRGGLGITVELKHGSYLTQYAHLSRIAKEVKVGTEVKQGDVIGYVGSTGISTGPHLQYALFENGTPINPLTSELPSGEFLASSEKGKFEMTIAKFRNALARAN